MNNTAKRRLIVVSGIIIVVIVVVLAVVGSSGAAKAATVEGIANGEFVNQKVQVSGKVVENSYSKVDGVLTFAIYDEGGDSDVQAQVRYEGSASATFGNNVTAICTGRVDEDGVVHASELVTKCPSKYENATEALSVADLLGYGDKVVGNTVKVTGMVKDGTLVAAGEADVRFTLVDADGAAELPVAFDDALAEDVADGSTLVVTGSIDAEGTFTATDVSIAE